MAGVTQLGYLGISVKDLDSWRGYATDMLGLEEAGSAGNGSLLLGMDGYHHRFQINEGGADDIGFVGWEADSTEDLGEIAVRLQGAGIAVAQGSVEEAEKRHVRELISFTDPDGHRNEVFVGPEKAPQVRESRFVADELGLGHLVLFVDDLDKTMKFYTEMLGFRVSDYVNNAHFKLGFLHCNPRHHSIAFGQFPAAKQNPPLHAPDPRIDPVGRAFDEASSGAAELVTTLGRHSNDEMVSFYMRNPSGFAVEYGWGAREIDDACWEVMEYNDGGSLWGHKPVRAPKPEAAVPA